MAPSLWKLMGAGTAVLVLGGGTVAALWWWRRRCKAARGPAFVPVTCGVGLRHSGADPHTLGLGDAVAMNQGHAKSLRITDDGTVHISTTPGTDLWKRSFYGFQHTSAPAILVPVTGNVTMRVEVTFRYRARFDQAGILVWVDEDCWAKASIEYEDRVLGRLGSVVTNGGHSDWATTDVDAEGLEAWVFGISRRGPDLLIESGPLGGQLQQMRIFHLAGLGDTDAAAAAMAAPATGGVPVYLGVYACSPTTGSFTASFTNWQIGALEWGAHS